MRSSYLAGESHTGQVQVGFFSFIIRKSEASKHWVELEGAQTPYNGTVHQ